MTVRDLSALRGTATALQRRLVQASLLSTWQTAAAIAQHAGVPARTALAVLQQQSADWKLEHKVSRIDGHNEVHMFRQRQVVVVLGVAMPVAPAEEI